MIRNCISCEADKKKVKAVWVNPLDEEYGEAYCDKCYKETLKMIKNFKRIR